MWDPDPAGAGVKLPIDFTATALTHPPLLGARNLIFPYSGEVKVELLDCPVKLRGEKQGWYFLIKNSSEIKPPQHNRTEHVLVVKIIHKGLWSHL